ncbi:MAG: hypothetical protein RLY31_1290 [Bacteroidota bacterium]|jgi:ribosome maturation factor RimP
MHLESFFIEEQIRGLLAQQFEEQAFQDCFLVELHLHPGNKLVVYVDCDSGMTLEKCRRINRFLEAHLDENGWLGTQYGLEVSSPGLDRPLTLRRQYVKNIGRELAITLQDGQPLSGKLEAVGETSVTLSRQVVTKEGKRNRKTMETMEVPLESIRKALVAIRFNG